MNNDLRARCSTNRCDLQSEKDRYRFFFAVVYSTLLTKTNRIARIFNTRKGQPEDLDLSHRWLSLLIISFMQTPLMHDSVLIHICTVYAILTRKIPEVFNESKYIGLEKLKPAVPLQAV
ncbi:hypothetical protein CHUAL_012899 [Chamberlinius hualienensis]